MFRSRRFPLTLAAAGSLAVALTALPAAAQTIDQQFTSLNGQLDIGTLNNCVGSCGASGGWFAQSFKPTQTTSAGASIALAPRVGTSGTLLLDLWNARPDAVGATRLANGSGTWQFGTTYTDVFFGSTVAVTPEQTYWLAFYSATPVALLGDFSGYTRGDLTYNGSNTTTNAYQVLPTDVGFKEYATGRPVVNPPTTAVPEPGTVALVAAGLAGVVAVRRRQRVLATR